MVASLVTGGTSVPLIGCDAAETSKTNLTQVYVLGTIHSNHVDSETYSLNVLESAIRAASPDIVLTEIPPDRINQAITSFRETGVVDEPRTQVFPEYTDVMFPLSCEMGFRMVGTAGWTRKIADDRRVALERIRTDPSRSREWADYRNSQREFITKLAGRGDDPRFIHTQEFDDLIENSRYYYQEYFDDDLGAGGWTQINRAHTELINAALDSIKGQGLTALITFGTAHKYLIHRALANRADVEVKDAAALFN
ncbi:hypothetical protein [Erythrobacter sp. Alg231-14]|uniref:hypothetical protein n=1 Tax=Erythrobacter sp. Alg231-14 TaxID=1922225 RepID=UPI00307B25AE